MTTHKFDDLLKIDMLEGQFAQLQDENLELKKRLEQAERDADNNRRWFRQLRDEKKIPTDNYWRDIAQHLGRDFHKLRQFTLGQWMDEIKRWSDHNWPGRSTREPLCSVVEEVGELMRADSKGRQNIRGGKEHWDNEAKKEFVDVLIGLFDYAALKGWTGSTLREIITVRWNDVKQRDWRRFPENGKTE